MLQATSETGAQKSWMLHVFLCPLFSYRIALPAILATTLSMQELPTRWRAWASYYFCGKLAVLFHPREMHIASLGTIAGLLLSVDLMRWDLCWTMLLGCSLCIGIKVGARGFSSWRVVNQGSWDTTPFDFAWRPAVTCGLLGHSGLEVRQLLGQMVSRLFVLLLVELWRVLNSWTAWLLCWLGSKPILERVRVLETGDGRISKFSGDGAAIQDLMRARYTSKDMGLKFKADFQDTKSALIDLTCSEWLFLEKACF